LDVPLGADVPVVFIKERGIKKPVQLNEIASGMQKVLLIITDVVTAPPDTLYMIDEYENSLGVNAIDFLPSFLNECGGSRQFIVTTHHPLLINAIPVSDWFVFHRRGLNIKVAHGSEIEARYGRSKQQRFVQLINDPLYTAGVE
jgi:predicted ATPase